MCRIIVTVLLGFLQFGTITSIAVFIYVFGANAFFLVRPLLLVLPLERFNSIAPIPKIRPTPRPLANASHGFRGRYGNIHPLALSTTEKDSFLVFDGCIPGFLDGLVIQSVGWNTAIGL
jgi:hypothetical protein